MSFFLSNHLTYQQFLSFLLGFTMMLVELAGSRSLAPYCGNTVFVWSSILVVVMGGGALGNLWGGRFTKLAKATASDQNVKKPILILQILLGISILLSPLILAAASPLALQLPVKLRSLILAITLLALPNLLIGALYTLCYDTAAKNQRLGQIIALSSAGSILGTLGTGFFLFEILSLSAIYTCVGSVIIFIGIISLPFRRTIRISALMLLPLGLLTQKAHTVAPDTLAIKSSSYNTYVVTKTIEDNKLYHHINTDLIGSQSRALVRIADREPSTEEFKEHAYPYIKFYGDAASQLSQTVPKRILILGSGGYVLHRIIENQFPQATLVSVDIDPMMYALAKQYFNFEAKVEPIFQDARMYLISENARTQHKNEKFDWIFIDLFSAEGIAPSHLITQEFFSLVASQLADDGVVISNIIPRGNIVSSLAHTALASFKDAQVRIYDMAPDANQMLVISKYPKNITSGDVTSSKLIFASTHLEKDKKILEKGQILHDDFASYR